MAARFVNILFRPLVLGLMIALMASGSVVAQDDDFQRNRVFFGDTVGGVSIDTNGVLSGQMKKLNDQMRDKLVAGLQSADQDILKKTNMRMVSVNGLNEVIANAVAEGKPLPAEAQFMAGLQRIEYIVLAPEKNDIVLAGPGEGWKVDENGLVVGKTTNMPVLRLEDFLVAMRSVDAARQGQGISVSIDPTPEGVQKLQRLYRQIGNFRPDLKGEVENAMGPQQIRLTGVPADSRFSQVLVAADYKMKRLSMGLEASPIADMPSLLEIAQEKNVRFKKSAPRFWMECNYKPVAKSADGNVWQLRGQGVRTLTEEGFFDKLGQAVDKKGKTNKFAQKWADTMTARFDELSQAEPVFRELRNVMDLAVVAAIIKSQDLMQKVSCEADAIQGRQPVSIPSWNVPKTVPTECSFVRLNRAWLVTASGGVQVDSWSVAMNSETVESLASVHKTAVAKTADRWWWNAN